MAEVRDGTSRQVARDAAERYFGPHCATSARRHCLAKHPALRSGCSSHRVDRLCSMGQDCRLATMEPLFDMDCELVGWVDVGRNVFNLDLEWVAYISHDHAWSAETSNWMGPVRGTVCMDEAGHVVAWSPGTPVSGAKAAACSRAPRPPRPPRPPGPPRPPRPSTPIGGWSQLSFAGWLAL